ncbi:MAG TPA: PLP-dependent aminotransferase family protein [Steroidobacteraceae bacterium]|nr:PLP-dependent aminotransferase family protein [Steroidobacteraceae bacterium]
MEPLFQLRITLPGRGSRSLRSSLHGQLRAAILEGRLKPGVRLPSTRSWPALYGISRNTAVAAYDLLLSEGYLTARRGSGTVVAGVAVRAPDPPAPVGRRAAARRIAAYWLRQRSNHLAGSGATPRFAFQLGIPDLARFPFDVWRRLTCRAMRRLRGAPPVTPDGRGEEALREAIARHVSFARAVACRAADVVVTAGAQQAFDLLARVLALRGRDCVAMENPGYFALRAAFEAHGSKVAPVAVDAEGLMVERIAARARVVCVTPSHQFPLGTVMSAQRRLMLLEHCRRRGAVVIEDDYDAEFRFVDRPLDALQTLDSSQSVFYVGTFSKSLAPDLRLGYIVSPPWAVAALAAAKRVADGHSSSIAQAALACMIAEGHLARHVRRMQRIYQRRRELLLGGLRANFEGRLVPLPSVAGLHVTAQLAASCSESRVVENARRLGVQVSALGPFYAGAPAMRGLVLGYGNIDESAIEEGLRRLRQSLPEA